MSSIWREIRRHFIVACSQGLPIIAENSLDWLTRHWQQAAQRSSDNDPRSSPSSPPWSSSSFILLLHQFKCHSLLKVQGSSGIIYIYHWATAYSRRWLLSSFLTKSSGSSPTLPWALRHPLFGNERCYAIASRLWARHRHRQTVMSSYWWWQAVAVGDCSRRLRLRLDCCCHQNSPLLAAAVMATIDGTITVIIVRRLHLYPLQMMTKNIVAGVADVVMNKLIMTVTETM